MDEPPTFRVWSWPSLGGWLAMLNGGLWVAGVIFMRAWGPAGPPDWLDVPVTCILLLVSLPVALPFVLPSCPLGGYPDDSEVVAMGIVFVLNAFAWGYGLAWLIGGVKKWIELFRGRSTPGGASNARG